MVSNNNQAFILVINSLSIYRVEGTAILVAVITVILTNAINYQKETQFKKLK